MPATSCVISVQNNLQNFFTPQDQTLDLEQMKNDKHRMRAYNEVLDKQPTSRNTKNSISKLFL
jgi:hypothetical protein